MSFWENDSTVETRLKAGMYPAVLFNIEMKESKKGDPILNLQWKLSNNSRQFQAFTFKNESAKWILWQLGIVSANDKVKEQFGKIEDMTKLRNAYYEVMSKMVGNTYVELEVSYEEYNGKDQTRVKLMQDVDATTFSSANAKLPYESVTPISNTSSSNAVTKKPDVGNPPAFDEDEELPF